MVSVAADAKGTDLVLQMTGPWTASNLPRLTAALRVHAAIDNSLTIDCTHATFADSSVAGALSQLYAYRTRTGLPLVCRAPVLLPARSMLAGSVPMD
jgi:anti-anti-sigma regulatory factor